ncbi:MAG: hypothetical protein ACC630_05735 [Nitrospinota bacterium]
MIWRVSGAKGNRLNHGSAFLKWERLAFFVENTFRWTCQEAAIKATCWKVGRHQYPLRVN